MQALLVSMLVIGCTVYAAWTLMPAAARRSLAVSLLKLPVPAALSGPLLKAAKGNSGCGCDGCDHAPKSGKAGSVKAPAAPAQQPITFHPRARH